MSNKDEQRQIYEMRAKILKDKVSALNKAREEAIKEGIEKEQLNSKEEKLKIAKSLLGVLDDNTIAEKSRLSVVEVNEFKKQEIFKRRGDVGTSPYSFY